MAVHVISPGRRKCAVMRTVGSNQESVVSNITIHYFTINSLSVVEELVAAKLIC